MSHPWTCPRCGTVHGPWMPSCNCRPGTVAATSNVTLSSPERDDTAELVEAVKSGLHFVKWAEEHGHMGAPSARDQLEAVLARVRGDKT